MVTKNVLLKRKKKRKEKKKMAHPHNSVSLLTRLWPFWDYDSSSLDAEQLTTSSPKTPGVDKQSFLNT